MPTKPVIDIDPELLRRSADARVHAFTEAWDHITKESTGHIPTILATLVPDGPWAWAIMTHAQPDGSIALPVVTTFDGIEEMYKMIRGHSDVLDAKPMLDVRGEWYDFVEVYARNQVKTTGEIGGNEMVLLLPVTSGAGITGELAWVKADRTQLGKDVPLADPKEPLELRLHLLDQHDRMLDALRAGDPGALAPLCTKGCQAALRDYVDDTGTLVALDDVDGLRQHYEAFFARYDVTSIEVLERVVQEWYLFAEIRFEVTAKTGDARGNRFAFNTGTILVPGRDDRFIVQIGHGTDLAPLDS
jgi:hypothetical protein